MRSNCEQASRKRVAVSRSCISFGMMNPRVSALKLLIVRLPLLRGLGEEQVAVVAQVRTSR